MEEITLILEDLKEQLEKSLGHLDVAFSKIRAGKASPAMLSSVMVEYYGSPTPLSQVANINVPDAMTLSVAPWEKNLIGDIERAIINSNLGFAPNNNGESIIINLPPLTEERRRELAKQAKGEAEDTKVAVRNHRQDAMKDLKKVEGVSEDLIKDSEDEVQKIIDGFIKKIDDKFSAKEAEIMKV